MTTNTYTKGVQLNDVEQERFKLGDWSVVNNAHQVLIPVADGGAALPVAPVDGPLKRPAVARKTELDAYIEGGAGVSALVRRLLSEATVICPLRAVDRYWEASDSTWRSRNYGTLGGGVILGNATQANVQLTYTDGQKGVRLLASGGVGIIQIPNAWINADAAWTVLVRYQRPAGVATNYAQLMCIGDVGAGNGTGRFYARALTTDTLSTSVGGTGTAASTYIPRVLVVSAATGGAGAAVKLYVNGGAAIAATKLTGTLSSNNHPIGGHFNTGTSTAYGYAHWNILDIVVIPRQLTDAEATYLARAVQYDEAPKVDILTGQSNMVGPGGIGNGEPCALPALPITSVLYTDETTSSSWNYGWNHCDILPNNTFGPELTICAARPNRHVVKYGQGGTSSWGWIGVDPSAALGIADGLMRAFWQLSCKPVVENVVYMQGETDAEIAAATMTPEYRRDRLISVAEQLRLGTNRTAAQCRFVLVRINSAIATFPSIVSFDNVRAGDALFVAQDANARLVDTDGLAYRANDLHYANQGILDAGARIAAQMQL